MTHTRIQCQDWVKSSKILTLMSRALKLSRRPLGRDRVGRAVVGRAEGQSCRDGGTHLIPWLMEVLPEIPGNSNCVLLGYGTQRPRAGGREQLLGGRAQSFALKVSGRTSATALGGQERRSAPSERFLIPQQRAKSSVREPRPRCLHSTSRPPLPAPPPHTLLCSGLALRKPPLPALRPSAREPGTEWAASSQGPSRSAAQAPPRLEARGSAPTRLTSQPGLRPPEPSRRACCALSLSSSILASPCLLREAVPSPVAPITCPQHLSSPLPLCQVTLLWH